MAKHPWVILLDIDGTLLTVNRGFNRELLRKLLDRHQINYPEMEQDSFSGRTDHDIFTSFLVNHDYDEGLYRSFKTSYLRSLSKRLTPERVTRHDYVDETITYFSREQFIPGLLTGNYPEAASYKLRAANISLNYSIGAFGEFDRDRNQLPYLAIDQFKEKLGIEPDPSRFVIIGDTPRDVICAKNAGMKSVAVTTGKFTEDKLAEYNPDLIIKNLATPHLWFSAL